LIYIYILCSIKYNTYIYIYINILCYMHKYIYIYINKGQMGISGDFFTPYVEQMTWAWFWPETCAGTWLESSRQTEFLCVPPFLGLVSRWHETMWHFWSLTKSCVQASLPNKGEAKKKTRCSPQTRMLTRMLMAQMSKHMDMQSRRTLFCNSLFEHSCTYFPCYHSAVWSVK